MTGRLDGKVVIIAGAASRGEGVGTGHAMAVLSAREGAKVVLVNRTADRAEALREEITAEGGDAMVFTGDVSKEEDAQAMVAAAEERYGKVTGLVNNVGGGHPGTVVEIAEDDWDRVVQINLKTAMQGTKAAIPATTSHAMANRSSRAPLGSGLASPTTSGSKELPACDRAFAAATSH